MPLAAAAGDRAAVTDLSSSLRRRSRLGCRPFPPPVAWALAAALAAGIALGVLVLAVVRNGVLLVVLVPASVSIAVFFIWNAAAVRSGRGLRNFLRGFPDCDLRFAGDGDILKISGTVSCGEVSLFSAYERVENCVYTSTVLYSHRGWCLELSRLLHQFFSWNLSYAERYCTDFYITDAKSGIQALVKAGYNSKVVPMIDDEVLIQTTPGNRALSLTLRKWLTERCISTEECLIRLQEGYVNEGMSLTVIGMLSRKGSLITITPPREPLSTGCLLRYFLLPVEVDGIVLSTPKGRAVPMVVPS